MLKDHYGVIEVRAAEARADRSRRLKVELLVMPKYAPTYTKPEILMPNSQLQLRHYYPP